MKVIWKCPECGKASENEYQVFSEIYWCNHCRNANAHIDRTILDTRYPGDPEYAPPTILQRIKAFFIDGK